MKKIILATIALITIEFSQQVQAQNLSDVFNTIFGSEGTSSSSQNSNNQNNGGGLRNHANNNNNYSNNNTGRNNININNLSNGDITSALRQALEIGAQNASKNLSKPNGFFGNAMVKILLPPEAQQVESTLRSVGLGSIADKAILMMNRAAEDAAVKAAPIFINAIKHITIQDGLNILQGGNNAATNFLKAKTTTALMAAFAPVIAKSLDKFNVPQIWNTLFSTYNQLPFSQNKVNTDLTAYVTQKALDGIFKEIGIEEQKIRTNPASQVTNLLQRVFGGLR